MKIPNPNPCPKCEMENMEVVEIDGWKPWWRVVCPDCGYESASQSTIKKAVEWHNITSYFRGCKDTPLN